MAQKIKELFIFMMRLLPLRKMIVFESHPDFSDNTFALYEELLRRGVQNRYKMYWIRTFHADRGGEYHLPENVGTIQKEPHSLREVLKRAYVLNCCRVIIDCNSFIYKRRKGQVRIHLGHGMPVKIDLEYSRKFGDCDKYLVLSQFWKDIYTRQIHVPEQCLCFAGYPRNDVLVNRVVNRDWQASVRSFHKVIIWLPTYRQHRLHMERAMKNDYPYGMPVVHDLRELELLQETLEREQILLLFRPHPVQELSVFERLSFSHIQIADDAYLRQFHMTLYELLGNTDGLITDYSSVYFDYLLTDQPVALTIEDLSCYFEHFTLAFPDYRQFIKGVYVEGFEGLLSFLEQMAAGEDRCREERLAAKRMFHGDTDGASARRIADLLADEYGIRA